MERLSLKVSGMHCHGCEMLIKDALIGIGVSVADVSYKNGTVSLLFNETHVTESQIKKAIGHEGFKVSK